MSGPQEEQVWDSRSDSRGSMRTQCRLPLTHPAGTVSVAKKPGFAMSLWLHSHDGEDYLSEAGAMNVWIIKQAADGCEWFCRLHLNLARLDPTFFTLPLPGSVVEPCGSRRLVRLVG